MSALNLLLREVPQLALNDAHTFLAQLTRNAQFMAVQVLPHRYLELRGSEPVVLTSFGSREATTCLQIFAWPAGATTPIHDHTAWGAYQCVIGALAEERYMRLDEKGNADTAHLRSQWKRRLSLVDGASTLGAYDAGIHKISNTSSQMAISIHLYGPRSNAVDGRDYDPQRHFVCDRIGDEPVLRKHALD